MNRGDARTDHLPHRAGDVERAAEPRIHVDQNRKVRDGGDPSRVFQDVGQGRNPEVRHAKRRVRDAGAGQV